MRNYTPFLFYKIILLLFYAMALVPLTAQDSAQDSVNLETILVTAYRTPETTKETTKSITVFTQEEIQELPVQSLDELLGLVAGVNLNTRNRFGVQSDIGMRGSTFSQVVVLLDDMRLNDPLTAHFNSSVPISLAEIQQIEIIRGSSSVSYGADAVGGIINIKTKNYVGNQPAGTDFSGQIAGGSNQFRGADAGLFYKKNRFSFSGSFRSADSEGEVLTNPNFLAGTSTDSLYNNFFDVKTYSAAISYELSPQVRFYTRASYDLRDFAAKYFYTVSAFDESTETTESRWLHNALLMDIGKHHLNLSTAWKKTDDLFVFNPAFTPNQHTTNLFVGNIQDNIRINDRFKMSIGGQLLQKSIVSTDRGNHDNWSGGVYVSGFHFLTQSFKLDWGLRSEFDENFGSEFVPQLGLAYFVNNDLKIRSSIGRSIRAADFTERFVSYLIPNLSPGRNIGNPDLNAESAWSGDIGLDYFTRLLKISASVFYRNSSDLIDFTLANSDHITNVTNLQAGENYFYPVNVSASSVLGLELAAKHFHYFGKKANITTQINYTWLQTKTDGDDISKYIANHPEHQVNILLNLNIGNFFLNTTTNWLTRNEEAVESINGRVLSSYLVNNLKMGYRLPDSGFSVFGQAQNLFDVKYQEILGAQLPGRWLTAGVQWEL